MAENILQRLDQLLAERRSSGDPGSSYTARLYNEGLDAILRKIGEESVEVVLAAKLVEAAEAGAAEGEVALAACDEASRTELRAELADLWFHCLVMLAYMGEDSSGVLKVLEQRRSSGTDAAPHDND